MPDGKKISAIKVSDFEKEYQINFIQYAGYEGKIKLYSILIDFIINFESENLVLVDVLKNENINKVKGKHITFITCTLQDKNMKLVDIINFLQQKYNNTTLKYSSINKGNHVCSYIFINIKQEEILHLEVYNFGQKDSYAIKILPCSM